MSQHETLAEVEEELDDEHGMKHITKESVQEKIHRLSIIPHDHVQVSITTQTE